MWQNIVRLTKNLKKKWLYVCVGARTHPKHIKKKNLEILYAIMKLIFFYQNNNVINKWFLNANVFTNPYEIITWTHSPSY